MTGQSRDREKVVPECAGQEISLIFLGKIQFREMAFGNADLYPSLNRPPSFNDLYLTYGKMVVDELIKSGFKDILQRW